MAKVVVIIFEDHEEELFKQVLKTINTKEEIIQYEDLKSEDIVFSSLRIVPSQRRVYWNEQEILLTTKEYEILLFLALHPKQVFTYQQIYEHCWGEPAYGNEKKCCW
ncbi:MAG: winged helix-turn-helix domain-containing protein [Massiliimalia sp.]|jgi:DNA-binding response OmpR family regulator